MAYTYKEYQQSDQVKQAQQALQNQQASKPSDYTSQWQSQLDNLMGQIQNRQKFSYDLNADALYNQYKNQYIRNGQLAMQDTMGQAAALTGGYGNSYAQQVGQQTYQQYLQGLNDKIPELYQAAYDRYTQEGTDLYNQYGLLSDREDQDYSRYQDALSNWLTERDYLANRYDAERDYDYGVYEGDRTFDYNSYIDQRDYEYQQARDAEADRQWQAAFDYQKEQDALDRASSGSSGGGGSGRSSSSKSSDGTSSSSSAKTVNGKVHIEQDDARAYIEAELVKGNGTYNAQQDLIALGCDRDEVKRLANSVKKKYGVTYETRR